jgi:hypothetical protein
MLLDMGKIKTLGWKPKYNAQQPHKRNPIGAQIDLLSVNLDPFNSNILPTPAGQVATSSQLVFASSTNFYSFSNASASVFQSKMQSFNTAKIHPTNKPKSKPK